MARPVASQRANFVAQLPFWSTLMIALHLNIMQKKSEPSLMGNIKEEEHDNDSKEVVPATR